MTLLVSKVSFTQSDSILTSLHVYDLLKGKKATIKDSTVVIDLMKIHEDLKYTSPESSEELCLYAYRLSEKIGYKAGVVQGLRGVGDMKMVQDQLDSSIVYIDQALDFAQKNDLTYELMETYYSKGNWMFYKSEYEKALEFYFKVDQLAHDNFPRNMAGSANGIGLVYRVIGNMEKSKEYFQEAYRLGKVYKDTSDVIQSLNNLGIIAKNEDSLELALDYYNEGLELAESTGNLRKKGEIYFNMSIVYQKQKNDELAIEYMEKSAGVTRIIGNDRGIALDYYNIAYFYMENKQFKKSIEKMELALYYGEKAQYDELVLESHTSLGECYSKIGDFKKAYKHIHTAYNLRDSMDYSQAISVAMEMENQLKLTRQAVEDSLTAEKLEMEQLHQERMNEEKLKSREYLLFASFGLIAMFIVGLFITIRGRIQLKKKNQIITKQKDEIEIVHKEITDSINYAQRIQNALISGNEEWDKISPQHYILFNPKDVVSGDFHWAYHSDAENISIWVTADCTGHGVPGAFMSVLGIGFLNEIIVESGKRNGGEILDLLRIKIIKALAQKNSIIQQKDGMDMALCIWDKNTDTLSYTGANNPLYVIRKTEQVDFEKYEKNITHPTNGNTLIELRANKMPVGFQNEEHQSFGSKTFQLIKGDLIISFTDGFADQFGGPRGKKLKYKPFKDILLDIYTKPVKLQSEILLQQFNDWRGNYEQIDDVCIVGIKV
ncbi:MAG: tetratricopeptide repeat protein [Crocinitomicaceae bacterium]